MFTYQQWARELRRVGSQCGWDRVRTAGVLANTRTARLREREEPGYRESVLGTAVVDMGIGTPYGIQKLPVRYYEAFMAEIMVYGLDNELARLRQL